MSAPTPPPVAPPPAGFHRPPSYPEPPRSSSSPLLWILIGFVAVIGAVVLLFTFLNNRKPNIRPDVFPPKIVKKHADGWMDVRFNEIPMTLRVPGRPAQDKIEQGEMMLFPTNLLSDYVCYACTGDKSVVTVEAMWLNQAGTENFSDPAELGRHVRSGWNGNGSKRETVDFAGAPVGAISDTFSYTPYGYPENFVAEVFLLHRKDLLVKFSVASNDAEVTRTRMEKALEGLDLK